RAMARNVGRSDGTFSAPSALRARAGAKASELRHWNGSWWSVSHRTRREEWPFAQPAREGVSSSVEIVRKQESDFHAVDAAQIHGGGRVVEELRYDRIRAYVPRDRDMAKREHRLLRMRQSRGHLVGVSRWCLNVEKTIQEQRGHVTLD